MDWKSFWDQYPTKFEETEFFKQVGKTVSGQPITRAQFEAQISDIYEALDLRKDDRVLDMCCGNGVVTAQTSKICRSVVGIDYSEALIKIAKEYNKPANVSYYCMSVLDQNIENLIEEPFTKIYMSESLQHFDEGDLPKLLQIIQKVSGSNAIIFFGGIPDLDKIWEFYNTEERREDYRKRKSENREAIGTWWKKKYIEDTCSQNGFECEFLSQSPMVHSAHYRFNARLTKQGR